MISRGDFLADKAEPVRAKPAIAMGCARFYLAPAGIIRADELPAGWGLLELRGREVGMAYRSAIDLRSARGFRYEMNLLLASLRRGEVRLEPQAITDFLKLEKRNGRFQPG